MAANINTMFYAGAEPWHSLGVSVDGELTAFEAIGKAGLDWEVETLPMIHPVTMQPTKFYGVVRKDDNQIFASNLSKNYKPLQNKDAFGFMDRILNDSKAKYHTAGSLGDSSRVWMLAKFPGHIRIKGTDDLTEKFLLLSNSHNGKQSVRVKVTPIRVVCQNTLNAAEEGGFVSVNHSQNLNTRMDEVTQQLGLLDETWKKTEEIYNSLASQVANSALVESIINSLIPLKYAEDETNILQRTKILELFEDNDGNQFPTIRGTKWALYNAITRYVDHYKAPHGNIKLLNQSKRAESFLFGSDFNLKERAMDLVLA